MSDPLNSVVVTVLSRNRGEFLAQTLESLLKQTRLPRRIVVLDNASDDKTVAVVRSFAQRGVEVDRTNEVIGVAQNFLRARSYAQQRWLMVAHDDDIYHPEYLEAALDCVGASTNGPAVIVGGMSFDARPTLTFDYPLRHAQTRCLDQRSFAKLLFDGYPVNFGATLYDSERFLSTAPDWDRFANLFDRPFLLECAKERGALLLDAPVVKYRVHSGQDVKNAAMRLPSHVPLALIANYRCLLRSEATGWPDSFARRGMFLLSETLRREAPSLLMRIRRIAAVHQLSPVDWFWGVLFYPYYCCRYRAARMLHNWRESKA